MTDQKQIQQSAPPENPSKSGFLIFCFVLMLLLSLVVLLPLYPNDFWPFLRIGQEIIKIRGIPTTEFMTYTQFNQPATYLYWLPSLIFYGVYNLGGVTLTGLIALICISCFYTEFWLCLRELSTGPLTSGFIFLITAVVGINNLMIRPQLLTYPLFGVTLLAILRWQKGDNRLLWFMPLVALLWANFHGSFILLFFILIPAILFGSGNHKYLLIASGIAFLFTFVNPYGPTIWLKMFGMINEKSITMFSAEWQPLQNKGWQANIFFATLLAIPVLIALFKPKIHLLYWVWFIGFSWMALSAVRYIFWFLALEAFLLAMLIKPFFDRYFERSTRFKYRSINLIIGIILLCFPLALLPGIRGFWWKKAPATFNDLTPVKATEWIKQHSQLPGEIWSDFSYSTYLTYALPERKVFMTNRFEDFSVAQMMDERHISQANYDWKSLMDKYTINMIMASTTSQPDLIRAVSLSSEWDEVYQDKQTIVFIRRVPIIE
jgi:hypothetical protein